MDKAALLSGKTIADWHYSDKGKNALSGLHVGQMVMDERVEFGFLPIPVSTASIRTI